MSFSSQVYKTNFKGKKSKRLPSGKKGKLLIANFATVGPKRPSELPQLNLGLSRVKTGCGGSLDGRIRLESGNYHYTRLRNGKEGNFSPEKQFLIL